MMPFGAVRKGVCQISLAVLTPIFLCVSLIDYSCCIVGCHVWSYNANTHLQLRENDSVLPKINQKKKKKQP